jgi:glycosyltransferase involved in cell wall biosynthesis
MSTRVPKVSVCVPSYNHSRFLPAALDSILAQTYQDFEIIIVDDGSTDDSLAIAERYVADHPSVIRLLTHPDNKNLGISATVNSAFNHVRGDYWMGLPSDDVLHKEKLSRQVNFLDQNLEYGWVYCYADFIDEDGRPIKDLKLFGTDISKDPDPVDTLIRRNKIPGMTALMRREVSANVGLHEEELVYSDWHYWVRMTAAAKVGFIDEPLIHYRIHGTNTSLKVDAQINTQRCIDVTMAIRRDIDSGLIARNTPRIHSLLNLQLCYFAYCLDQKDEAAGNLVRAFETDRSLLSDADYIRGWLSGWHSFGNDLFVSSDPASSFTRWFVEQLPPTSSTQLRKRVESELLAERALDHLSENPSKARQLAVMSLLKDPQRLSNRDLRRVALASIAGDNARKAWKRIKG